MKLLRVFSVLFIAVMLMAASRAQDSPVPNEADAKLAQLLNEGAKLAEARKFKEAVERFDSVIAVYEDRFRDTDDRVRCARWLGEIMYYLLEAGKIEPKKKVIGLSQTWADAYFMKAYVLVHVGEFAQAKPVLEKAINLSPSNSLYLSELGGIFQREKNWPMALQTFQSAERATEFSPPNTKNVELSKAWRGIAFVFVEQGRLDEAEGLYRKCLELDKNDTRAANELRYIEKVRASQSSSDPHQKKYFAPPSDYVPLDQIRIKPKFETVLLTNENLAAEHKKCVPFIQTNTERMDAAVKAFPRNNATIAVGHASSSRQFIYRGSTGLCLEFSANRYPIYAAETFIGTANPTGVPLT